MYSLKKPYKVIGNDDSFFIQYTSDLETVLEIYLGNEIKKEVNLPSAKDLIRYQVPIDSGELINSFRIRSADNKDNNKFRLISSGIEESRGRGRRLCSAIRRARGAQAHRRLNLESVSQS